MNLSHNKVLYDELFAQIVRMHDEVDYRKHLNAYRGQRGKQKDYPSVSVGAELDCAIAIGHHHSYSSPKDFHPIVFNALTCRLGKLNEYGRHYPECENRVGHCAENYAASGVIKRIGHCSSDVLSDIHFTMAFRPRSWKIIDWCDNCHTMFD